VSSGPRFSRSFRLAGDGLLVEEKLLDPKPMRGLVYRIPAGAEEIERTDRVLRYKLS
jgi:hypothetical protein